MLYIIKHIMYNIYVEHMMSIEYRVETPLLLLFRILTNAATCQVACYYKSSLSQLLDFNVTGTLELSQQESWTRLEF